MALARTRNIAGSKKKLLKLDKIRLDGDTQSRVELDQEAIREYAILMQDGQDFPPLLVVFDGASYWLVDGFHRRWAAVKAKLTKFKCEVVSGTRDDARWMSYGVNCNHGLRRSNEDKKRAVISALKHANGVKKSDRQIADHVGVSHTFVNKNRAKLESNGEIPQSSTRTGIDGRTIDTSNIGLTVNGLRSETVSGSTPTQEPGPVVPNPEPQPSEDAVGQEIPAKLRNVFTEAEQFATQSRALAAVKKWADEVSITAAGSYLHLQSFVGQLTAAQKQLKFEKPYAVCPYCLAKKAKCEACKGRGFVTKPIYDGAPSEMRV